MYSVKNSSVERKNLKINHEIKIIFHLKRLFCSITGVRYFRGIYNDQRLPSAYGFTLDINLLICLATEQRMLYLYRQINFRLL